MATIEFGSVTEGIPGVAGLAIVMVFMLFVVVRTVSRRRGELARMRAADAARAVVAEKSPKMYDVHIGEGADIGALDGWEKMMVRPRCSFSLLGADAHTKASMPCASAASVMRTVQIAARVPTSNSCSTSSVASTLQLALEEEASCHASAVYRDPSGSREFGVETITR